MNYRMVLYIVGTIMKVEGVLMLLPLFTGLIYGESSWRTFGVTIAFLLVAGLLLTLKKPENKAFYAKEGFVVVALSWLALSVFGAVPFWLSGEVGDFVDCLFESVSGFTTTGASVIENVEILSKSVQIWRAFTHWIGGMGVLVFMLAILPSLSGQHSIHLMRAESPGPSVGKLVPRLRDTASILYKIYFVMTVILVALLLLGGMDLFNSLFYAFGTAGTGGFGAHAASVGYFGSDYIEMVITIFMILFGVNFNIYFLLLSKHLLQAFKNVELRWYFGIIVASIGFITWNILPMYSGLGPALQDSAFQVASIITTTGFATADFALWPTLSRCVLLLLMFIGACAGSTGGGVKVSRLLIMAKAAAQSVRRILHPRAVTMVKMDDKPVDEPVITNAFAYMVCYLGILVISIVLLSRENLSFEATFSSVLSAMGNVGPALDTLGPTSSYHSLGVLSKLVLSFDMLAGRLEIFPMLILFSPRVWCKGQ